MKKPNSAHPFLLCSLHLWRRPEMVAPRALVFRLLGKGMTKSLGMRLTERLNTYDCYLFHQVLFTQKWNRVGNFTSLKKLSIYYKKSSVFIAN